jgi:sugar O-acyltransferase (sialic acid O-acetyltransferase NeuD family)
LKEKIAIFGAGDLGKEILVLIRQINEIFEKWDFIGYFDDHKKGVFNNFPVLGGLESLSNYPEKISLILAIADTGIKEKLVNQINNPDIHFPVLIHPTVQIQAYQSIKIGRGSIICAGNSLTCDIEIGEFVLLNLGCTIGHDCKFKDYCSIMPGVNLSGNVKLEKSVYVGTGAKLINSVTIGSHTVIGAGAVVTSSFGNKLIVAGVPAKVIKNNNLF